MESCKSAAPYITPLGQELYYERLMWTAEKHPKINEFGSKWKVLQPKTMVSSPLNVGLRPIKTCSFLQFEH